MDYVYNDINYNLSGKRRRKLVKTYESALSEFGAALGVRLDFGISTALTDLEICILDLDILDIYKRFSDSLHKHLDRQGVKYKRNWKLEHSEKKGYHIHTVYYFDYNSVQGFRKNSHLFKYIRGVWRKLTKEDGTIKLIDSCVTKDGQLFGVPNKYTNENDRQFSTILTNDLETLKTLNVSKSRHLYLKQKNQQDKTYGWIYWISYLAKQEQSASHKYKKCFG
jgi:hypothetical protein